MDNKIVFAKYGSYEAAESKLLNYNKSPIIPIDYNLLGIDKFANYYEFFKFQNGKVFKIAKLKSLEEIKAIRDILIHSNWDIRIFKKYDVFYLNGIYWKLSYRYNSIKLEGKFELI